MPQHRQYQHSTTSDHVAIGVRSKAGRARRSGRTERVRLLYGLSVASIVLVLCFVMFLALSMFYFISLDSKELGTKNFEDNDAKSDSDFLINVTRTSSLKILKFGKDSIPGGGDSRYWERDDRRRDQDYSEEDLNSGLGNGNKEEADENYAKKKNEMIAENGEKGAENKEKDVGLQTQDDQTDRKMFEDSVKGEIHFGRIGDERDTIASESNEEPAESDELDDEYDSSEMDSEARKSKSNKTDSNFLHSRKKDPNDLSTDVIVHKSKERKKSLAKGKFLTSVGGSRQSKTKIDAKKRAKRHPCEMKFLNISQIVEPFQTRKFARFNLQYVEREENSNEAENWEPKFAGHQSLEERENSFIASDKTIQCGFVKGSESSLSTGFDLAEDDANYISKCHVAVVSCIFGNSDRLRPPVIKMITRLSRKNVCFVMFMDERTLGTLTSENKMPDREGFVGLWKVVVVKNLPYTDMRRVGKVPKLLSHRLFPSARYSIWLDSKLRFQVDPLLVLEYFLWRKGHEYAISNHYDRHCVWDEVAQNKRLDKYNHTAIDEQFSFYKSDGLTKFDILDQNKSLPSNVPEGSFIVRAHTPMSNLFSCLWFNEVERFTPRDQLSFAYTYHKLRRMNPDKTFYLNMFKDCERRAIAKLFRHRFEEKRNSTSPAV